MTATVPSRTPSASALAPSRQVAATFYRCALLVLGLVIVLLRDRLLPARFFYDGDTIQAIAAHHGFAEADFSYQSAAAVYRAFGLAEDATAAAVASFLVFFVTILVASSGLSDSPHPRSAAVLTAGVTILGAVYLGTYSKDILVAPITLVALLARRSWVGELVLLGAMCGYASIFRTYWFLVAAAYVTIRLVLRLRPRVSVVVVAAVLLAVAVSGGLAVALGTTPDYFRTSTNDARAGSEDAASVIPAFLPGGTLVAGLVNVALTLMSLAVPVPLALRGGAYFLVLAAIIAAFWLRTGRIAALEFRTDRSGRAQRLVAPLIALLVVQALFEPDYGSALRHLTPLLPLALTLWVARPDHSPRAASFRPLR